MAHSAVLHGSENDPPSTQRRNATFESLRYRDYRYLWFGQVGASASQWMEQIARPFLILALTDSALMVGLLQATRMVPQLLIGMWAGVLADRLDKKKVLAVSQATVLVAHLSTAALILTGLIDPWMVFLTTFVSGSGMAFNQPTRQSMIARIVPEHALANAIALNSTAVNFMRIGGASLAGLLLAVVGFGEVYLLQGLVYFVVIYFTTRINMPPEEGPKERGSMMSELVDGLKAARDMPTIKYILMITLVIFILGVPYQGVFIPLIAERVLGIGESGGGLLVAVVGAGALTGSLMIATIGGSLRRRGPVMIGILCLMSAGLLILSRAETLVLAVPALLITGGSQTCFMSISQTYVLGIAPRDMHGRIMSLFSLDRGLVPLGAFIAGALAEWMGPQDGLLIMGGICLLTTLLLALASPTLRRIE